VDRPKVPRRLDQAQPESEPEGDSSASSGGGSTALAVVISVFVVLALLAAAAFVVLRTRLAPRLRARLTSTPYEDIVINRRRSESQQNVVA